MKKKLLTMLILSGICVFPAIAAQNADRGYISININESQEISPDVAEITFGIKTSDVKSLQKATSENKEISDKLYSMLSGMLSPSNGDYIKTANFNASPVYNYSNGKRTLIKYEVTNRVIVHTKSLEKVGTLIDKAISTGATNVDSLTFSVADTESNCNKLLETATKKAYSRAALISKNLASNLDGVRTFDTSCSTNSYNVPRMYLAKNSLADAAVEESQAAGTAISPGAIKLHVNVNATFFVK